MREEINEYIRLQPQLKQFLREQPIWYRKLGRNPHDIQSFEISALHHYKKTIPHRVEQFNYSVQMANMMMSMFQAMNSKQ
jgi:hypothetical protein